MKGAKLLLRVVLSAGLLYLVARKVNWTSLGALLGQLNVCWAMIASLLTGGLIAGLALRWRIFLRQQGFDFTFRKVLALTWAGQFFNSLLPGSTGGDVFKIFQVCRLAPARKAAAASTVLTDRFSAMLALLLLAASSFLIEPRPLRSIAAKWWPQLPAAGILAASCLTMLALLLALRFYRRISDAPWLGKARRTLAAALQNLVFSRQLLLAFSVAVAVHLLNFFIIYLFARALSIGVTYGQMLLVMPVVLLLIMAPLTINGHGLREVLLIAYFSAMNLQSNGHGTASYQESAIALSVLMVANELLWSLPGALCYLLRFRQPTPHLIVVPKPVLQAADVNP